MTYDKLNSSSKIRNCSDVSIISRPLYFVNIESNFDKSKPREVYRIHTTNEHFLKELENLECFVPSNKESSISKSFLIESDTNERESSNLATKINALYIDTSTICTFLGYTSLLKLIENKEDFIRFIQIATATNSEIKSYKDDSFSIAVPHCFNVDFAQYLGQAGVNSCGIVPSEFISHVINTKKRVIIQSIAGSGKTTLIQQLVKTCTKDRDRTIILLPTTTLTDQQTKDFQQSGLNVCSLTNTSTKHDLMSARDSSIIMCCYDSLKKIQDLIPNSFLIVDEYHQLSNDIDYRDKKSFRVVSETIKHHHKTLMLSATPNYFFTLDRELSSMFGFTLIKGTPTATGRIIITPITYKGKQYDIPSYINETLNDPNGLVLGKYDSKENLENIYTRLNSRGIKTEVFYSSSEKEKRKDKNRAYCSLMETGFINRNEQDKIKQVWFTSLLEAGVSIKDEVSLLALTGVKTYQRAVQLINRPRYNATTGTNKNINVWVFKNSEAKEHEQEEQGLNVVDRFKDLLRKYQFVSDIKNGLTEYEQADSYKTESDDRVHRDLSYKDLGTYKVCILSILKLINELENTCSIETLLKRVQRFDNRVSIEEHKQVKFNDNSEFKELKEIQKRDKRTANEELFKIAIQDFSMVAQVVAHLSRDSKLKERIRTTLELPLLNKDSILSFLENSNGAFSGREPQRIVKDVCFLVSRGALSRSQAIEQVIETPKDEIRYKKSSISRKARLKSTVLDRASNNDVLDLAREREITKGIDKLRKNISLGKVKEYLTKSHVLRVINKAILKVGDSEKPIFKPITEGKAIVTLKDLYHVEQKRIKKKNKKITVFRIVRKKE